MNQPKHRYQIYERNLDWFRFWLKSEESDDPGKASNTSAGVNCASYNRKRNRTKSLFRKQN